MFLFSYDFFRLHYKAAAPKPPVHDAAAPKPPVSSIRVNTMSNYHTFNQHLLEINDGRLLVSLKREQNWEGQLYLTLTCTEIHEDTYYRKDQYCNAKHHLRGYGVNDLNNVFLNQFQIALDDQWERYTTDKHGETDIVAVEEKIHPSPQLVVTRNVFTLPYEVEPHYYDLNDTKERTICQDSLPSGDWATFVLKKKKEEITSPERPGIRLRGRANGTATHAGLKRAPTDINTGFGDSNIGVNSGARPNPNLSIYGSNMMDTTSTNNDQFHSPVNGDGMGGGVIDPEM